MRDTHNGLSNFLGGRPVQVFVKLALISLFVGFVMAMFSLQPVQIFEAAFSFFYNMWEAGFDAFRDFGRYIVIGATLVVPIWLIKRVLSFRRQRDPDHVG